MNVFYRLDPEIGEGKVPIPCEINEIETGVTVQVTELDDVVISTVFLAICHQFKDGPPLVFETMVFTKNGWYGANGEGMNELYCKRDSTWECAEFTHDETVEKFRVKRDA